MGCCPFSRLIQLNQTSINDCFHPMNDLAQAFHLALDGLLLNISSQLPGMKYSLGNTFNMTLDVINAPTNNCKTPSKLYYSANEEITDHTQTYFIVQIVAYFQVVDTACCGNGTLNAELPCNSTSSLCPDREKYLFWDMFHPTQKASSLAAEALYYGPVYVSPISFSQLAQEN